MTNSYKTILKKLMFKLGFGFKKDRIQVCLGDEIPLELDQSLFKDNVKRAKKVTRKNSFARWFTGDGSEITDSKTIQDDVGNTVTRASLNGSLDTIIANDTGSTVHSLEATIGRPIYRMLIPEKQLVDTYISQKDYSYNIFLNDIKSEKNKGDLLTILPNGVMFGYHQPKASARLTRSTPVFTPDTWFQVGANLPFVKIRDEDGFNKSSNNFFLGDGAGKGAFYTFPYSGIWSIHFQFLIDMGTEAPNFLLEYRFTWGKPGSYLSLRRQYAVVKTIQSMSLSTLLPMEKGDIGFVELRTLDTRTKPFIYGEGSLRSIDNYMGFYLLVG